MRLELTERKCAIVKCRARSGSWAIFVSALVAPLCLYSQESAADIGVGGAQGGLPKGNGAQQVGEEDWQPKAYQFNRYRKMLSKDPFGKVPAVAPPPTVIEQAAPVEEKQLAIAGVSVVEGKPIVYLIDLKTRAYQKINTEGENQNKIRLVEINDAINPRDVVAEVMINGQLSSVKYDIGILSAKPKSVAKTKSSPSNVAGKRSAARRNTPPQQNNNNPVGQAPGSGNVQTQGAGKNAEQRIRDIQEHRRLSAVPRRRVIVPGRGAPR